MTQKLLILVLIYLRSLSLSKNKLDILVVEDSVKLVDIYKKMLPTTFKNIGYNPYFVWCITYSQYMKYKNESYNLILLDWCLDKQYTGADVIKKSYLNTDMIAVITGWEEGPEQFLEENPDYRGIEIFAKPTSFDDFVRIMRTYEKKRAEY